MPRRNDLRYASAAPARPTNAADYVCLLHLQSDEKLRAVDGNGSRLRRNLCARYNGVGGIRRYWSLSILNGLFCYSDLKDYFVQAIGAAERAGLTVDAERLKKRSSTACKSTEISLGISD